MVGIDLIPAQPPRGVSTIQGNFLSPAVRALVKTFVTEGAVRKQMQQKSRDAAIHDNTATAAAAAEATVPDARGQKERTAPEADRDDVVLVEQTSYIDAERQAARDTSFGRDQVVRVEPEEKRGIKEERLVDVSPSQTPPASSALEPH